MSKIFYISDLHFGHKNILAYDNRPFFTTSDMDAELIKNWNSVVSKGDTVYILGDVSWGDAEYTENILRQLNGRKILIRGNHDKVILGMGAIEVRPRFKSLISEVYSYLEIEDNGTWVVMCHFPIPFWNGQFRDSVHLYGHLHETHQTNILNRWMKEARELQDIPMRAINVGCMMPYMDYRPRTLDELLEANGFEKTPMRKH